MKHRLMTAVVLAGSMLASGAAFASPLALHIPVHAKLKDRMVSFNLRNNTSQVVRVKAGDTEMQLQPGKVVGVKLHSGDKVIAEDATATIAAGAVLVTASSDLRDATIVLN